jgi:hypothetical protein
VTRLAECNEIIERVHYLKVGPVAVRDIRIEFPNRLDVMDTQLSSVLLEMVFLSAIAPTAFIPVPF